MKPKIQIRSFNPSEISVDRIASMLLHMEPEEVAADLNRPWKELRAMLVAAGKLPNSRWAAQNRKTGQIIQGFSERGVYLKAQLLGWVDWFYCDPGKAA